MAQQEPRRAGAEGQSSRRTPTTGTGGEGGATFSDRELLEQIHAGLRRLEPLIEAAERHPLVRAFLRRS